MTEKEKTSRFSWYKEKSPHQKRWGAYKERKQARLMREESRIARAERRERIHSGRRRAGTALANAFAVLLAFILISVSFGSIDALSHGSVTRKILSGVSVFNSSTNSRESVEIRVFSFNDDNGFFEILDDSFSKISLLTEIVAKPAELFGIYSFENLICFDLDNQEIIVDGNSFIVDGKICFSLSLNGKNHLKVYYVDGDLLRFFSLYDEFDYDVFNRVKDSWGLLGEWISHAPSTYTFENDYHVITFSGYRLANHITSRSEFNKFISSSS